MKPGDKVISFKYEPWQHGAGLNQHAAKPNFGEIYTVDDILSRGENRYFWLRELHDDAVFNAVHFRPASTKTLQIAERMKVARDRWQKRRDRLHALAAKMRIGEARELLTLLREADQ